ncbi:MAG: HAMP domain-containing protein [Rhizobiales bacterium]|nr:HAMP domain-containing protein [Hyphomicrobiales bacterium]MBN9010031.1 HAMP domain-containing protein [Hyphomicrobiales bacterium]
MRRFLPDSLAAWSLVMLIAGLVVTQLSTLVVIAHGRSDVAEVMEFFRLAERVTSVTRAVATTDDPKERQELADALSDATVGVTVDDEMLATDTIADTEELAELEDMLESRLADVGISDVHVERWDQIPAVEPTDAPPATGNPGPLERVLTGIEERFDRNNAYVASIALKDGKWLNFTVLLPPRTTFWSPGMLAVAGLVILVVLAASLVLLRYLTAPYDMLGRAAERIGRDLNAPALGEGGPREIRAAARAFNTMQGRLQKVIADRDQLVGAIAHDLRTPVTRLRLRADFMEDSEQRAHMIEDLDEIAGMTQSILDFSSDNATPEARETLDLVSLLEVLTEDRPGVTLELPPDCPPRLAYSGQPIGLRRCIGNLVENAVKYGGTAAVSLHLRADAAIIRVEDNGPGIPEADMETVFMPFRRLEVSRSRETGGTGLGLTIARTIARAHGGDVHLENRPGGKGLRAEILLPLAAPAARGAA